MLFCSLHTLDFGPSQIARWVHPGLILWVLFSNSLTSQTTVCLQRRYDSLCCSFHTKTCTIVSKPVDENLLLLVDSFGWWIRILGEVYYISSSLPRESGDRSFLVVKGRQICQGEMKNLDSNKAFNMQNWSMYVIQQDSFLNIFRFFFH